MKAIYKYKLEFTTEEQPLELPFNSSIVMVAFQLGTAAVCLWAQVHTDQIIMVQYKVRIFSTGQEIPANFTHVGSFMMPNGFHPWHVCWDC